MNESIIGQDEGSRGPRSTLASALGWAAWFRSRRAVTTLLAIALEIAVLLPFTETDPIPYFGLPGALALGIAISVAVAAGAVPGGITAAAAGAFFLAFVADREHPFSLPATLFTVLVWIAVALTAGLVAESLRSRLSNAFAQSAEREREVHGTLEAAAAAVGVFVGPRLRCRNANARLRSLFATDDWEGRPLADLLPDVPGDAVVDMEACARHESDAVRVDEVTFPSDGRTYSLSARCTGEPGKETLFLTLSDVTAVTHARQGLERLLSLTPQLHAGESPRGVAEVACHIACELFGCQVASFWTLDGDRMDLTARVPEPPPVTSFPIDHNPDVVEAVATNRPTVVADVCRRYVKAPVRVHSDLPAYIAKTGHRSVIWLPIPYAGDAGALLFLGWSEPIEPPSAETMTLAQRLAEEAAIAVERAERLAAQQAALAAEQQASRLHERLERSLLPRMRIGDDRLAVEFRYRAGVERMLIGGDFLGALDAPDGSFALLIGDVSGRGPDAAALGATLRAAWRALTLDGAAPATVMQRLDDLLRRDRGDDSEFATVSCAWISVDLTALAVILAGHQPPLILGGGEDGTQVVEAAVPYGPPLGIIEGHLWTPTSLKLPSKWGIALYTDGLIEGLAAPDSRERYGPERLREALARAGQPRAIDGAALDRLLDEIQQANGGRFTDDAALLYVARRGTRQRTAAAKRAVRAGPAE